MCFGIKKNENSMNQKIHKLYYIKVIFVSHKILRKKKRIKMVFYI